MPHPSLSPTLSAAIERGDLHLPSGTRLGWCTRCGAAVWLTPGSEGSVAPRPDGEPTVGTVYVLGAVVPVALAWVAGASDGWNGTMVNVWQASSRRLVAREGGVCCEGCSS